MNDLTSTSSVQSSLCLDLDINSLGVLIMAIFIEKNTYRTAERK